MNSRQKEHTLIEHVLSFLSGSKCGASSSGTRIDGMYLQTAREIRDFLEEIPGGFLIYRAGDDESIIYANRALIHIFACKTFKEFQEYTGNSFRGLVYSEDLEAVEQSIKNQIECSDDDLDYVEYRIKDKDGNFRWIEDYGHFVHDDSVGDVFYVFLTDATEKKLTQLRELDSLKTQTYEKDRKIKKLIEEYDKERKLINQEHLRRLEVIEGLSANYDSILYVDLDSNSVFPYRLSSRIVKQFDGKFVSREYTWFADDYVETWVHPDDRDGMRRIMAPEYIRKTFSQSNTYYQNFRCLKDGRTLYLQIRIVNVSDSKRASQVVIGYRNVDDEIKREMEHNQALEDALKTARKAEVAKNTFLSNMSHDMRTPLNAIFGFAELAKKNLSDPRAVEKYLEKIVTAGNQILELVNKVLDLAYFESESMSKVDEPCNLIEFVDDVAEAFKIAAEQKDLGFEFTCNIEDADVYVDIDKLRRVLAHLTNNAVKYTSKGKVALTVEQTGKRLNDFAEFRFSVSDTGVGISAAALPHIFDPFEREYNTTLSGVLGTGLGLTIAKDIVNIMGGKIEVDSKKNKGSTFTVTLRLKLTDDANAPVQNEENADGLIGRKILVVEDNEINLEIETEILEGLGFVVDTAENGQVAVDKVKAADPDEYAFVLMDLQMPVMDGWKAAENIRSLGTAQSRIPIIALSANAFESDRRTSMEAGMDAHLNKPIDVVLLLETVTKIVAARGADGK